MTRITIHRGGQQDDEWRRLRLGCATGSGFADVLSKSRDGKAESTGRRNYRVRLALELLTGEPEQDGFTNRAIQTGIEREPIARARFEEETGHLVEEVSFIRLNTMNVGCSPDGLIGDDAGLEIKCPTKAAHLEYLSLADQPPAEYLAQVQGCLYVTGRSHWHFVSFNPEFPPELQIHHIVIQRDELYIKRLEDELWRFTADVKATVREIEQLIEQRRQLAQAA
jgi:predicted phage-related endonuclease